MNRPNRGIVLIALLISIGAFAALYYIEIDEPYIADDVLASAKLVAEGHTYKPLAFQKYNALDVVVVKWSDNKFSAYVNNGLAGVVWGFLGSYWVEGETPPDEACDEDAEIEGCKPKINGTSVMFMGCPPGCGTSPYVMNWTATNYDSFDIEVKLFGSWLHHYSGTATSTTGTSVGTLMTGEYRVRAKNSYGNSGWTKMFLPVQCTSNQNPW
ncbi:MAG: hypothetical protein OEU36_20160 [Gammaproteobacteria bacterium]|nr:hypothetical protein [Gammaproteobacteria bacterium]